MRQRNELTDRHYLIEDVIPEHTINLLGGPVGAGKSSWLIPALLDFMQGKPVLDNEVHPVPFAYVSADRGLEDVKETMYRLGFRGELPFPVFDVGVDQVQLSDIFTTIPPETRLIVVEALPMLMGDSRINDYFTVGRWLKSIRQLCVNQNLTIIGTCHTAKAKEGDSYSAPKQRFLGSIAWGGFADTLMLLEPKKPSDPENQDRTMWIMPKNRADMRYDFVLNTEDGRLVQQAKLDPPRLQLWATLPQGVAMERKQLLAHGEELKIPMRTCDRLLKKMVQMGELVKTAHGQYTRPLSKELQSMVIQGE